MAAPILEIDAEHPNPKHLQTALTALQNGFVIAYPTDSYYALGCDMGSKKGIERLYEIKGRDRKKPLALLCHDLSHVADYAKVSNFAYRTMKHYTPGPFTWILTATKLVPTTMQTKQQNVGIRVPDAGLARELARLLGRPLVTTSATDREGNVLHDARAIKDALGKALELILDDGEPQAHEPSTVVMLKDDQLEILRQGSGLLE